MKDLAGRYNLVTALLRSVPSMLRTWACLFHLKQPDYIYNALIVHFIFGCSYRGKYGILQIGSKAGPILRNMESTAALPF